MSSIVTGANLYRAKTIITAAQIHGLDTTPVLIVPPMPGKVLELIAYSTKYNFGTTAYAVNGHGGLYYGNSNAGPAAGGQTGSIDMIARLVNGFTQSQFFNLAAQLYNGGVMPGSENFADVIGLGIFLVEYLTGFMSGAATAATPTAGNQGLLYALNDTGLVSGAGDGTAVYTVTGETAGAVTSVSVTGGNGYTVGTGITTTVSTGSGDGTLELDITAIRELGDGTVEYDVIYQPL